MKHVYHWIAKKLPAIWIVMAVLASSLPVQAQTQSVDSSPPNSPQGLAQATEIQAYWDDFFPRHMETYGVHGAVMVIVKDGGILFMKGYGFADAVPQTPMDPANTILRAGSIAKTVTATAVMQLAERGQLDLDADINDYLKGFQVEDTFPEPVTARQLINMTGGFDTRAIGIRAPSAEKIQPLGDYLAERMPPRVLPPGRYRRYNDHEIALAGYLVEEISGVPYAQYVEQNIFSPLEMAGSSVLLPDAQLHRAARGYPVGGGAGDAYPLNYYYLNDAPGSGFNTTALDMAHYMIAHLQKGVYTRGDGNSVRILNEETASMMQQTAFSYHPDMLGQANSFDEQFYRGHRYLKKYGGAPGMQNDLILLVDQGLGFYLFYNSEGTGLRRDWENEILKMYLASPGKVEKSSKPIEKSNADAAAYAGWYQEVSDRTSDTTIVQVRALVNPDLTVKVESNPDGSLRLFGERYVPVEPDVFMDSASGGLVKFERGETGQADYLFQARTPYRRVAWMESPAVQLGLLSFALVVFLSGITAFGIQVYRKKFSGRLLPGWISVLNLVFLVGLVIILLPVATGGDIWQFSFNPSLQLRAILALPLVTTALAAGLVVDLAIAWWKGRYSLAIRIHNSLILLGMVVFVYFLHTWNLLGWRF